MDLSFFPGKEELQAQTLIPNRALKDAIEQHIRDHPEVCHSTNIDGFDSISI